jgi:hypothetical protein
MVKPRVTPDARPTWLGRYFCPITITELEERNRMKPIGTMAKIAARAVVRQRKTGSMRAIMRRLIKTIRLYPIRSPSLPPRRVPKTPQLK